MQAQLDNELDHSLASLLAPMTADDFFEHYWERAPLHIPGRSTGRFTQLFSRADMDRLLADYGYADTMSVRLAKYENDRTEIVDPARANSAIDPNRIFAAYCDGFTVNLNNINQRHTPARRLAASLSEAFGCMVNINAYLTPGEARAFPLHFDTHSVLIIQVEGTKSWRVYAPRFPLPSTIHKPPHTLLKSLPGGPMTDLVLQAGDILYVPRGFGHEAATQAWPSLHLTVALHPFTYLDLIQESLNLLGWDLSLLRQSVRCGVTVTPNQARMQREHFRDLRAHLAQDLPLEQGFDALVARRLAAQPAESACAFATTQMADVSRVHLDSRVRKRPGMACKVLEGCGFVAIHYPSHSVMVELPMWQALEFIAESEDFVVSSLPGWITDEQKLALVRRLVIEGLLIPTSSPE